MTLRTPETAPRDMTVFLADVGYPWLVLAVWNDHQNEFVTTNFQIDLYRGKWNDTYFENEYHAPDKLKGWMPLPEIPKCPTP